MTSPTMARERTPERTLPAGSRASVGWPATIWALLILSLLVWRNGTYYAGGIDPVVVGKAAVGFAALVLALMRYPLSNLGRLGSRTVALVVLYLAFSLVGALANDTVMASAVLSLRLSMMFLTVALLVCSCSREDLVTSFMGVLLGIGTILAVTGIGSLVSTGRLTGGVLPTAPNQMAMIFGPVAIYLMWRFTRPRATVWHALGLVATVAAVWLTGSRSGLLGLCLGVVAILLVTPIKNLGTFIVTVLAVPGVLAAAVLTPALESFFARGGTQNLLTLNARTIAWQAALGERHDFYTQWFGGGISVRTVAVSGTYWDTQVLDSSWLSTLVQAGVIGLVLLAVWSLSTVWLAARSAAATRGLWLGLVVFALFRSFLETGLLDTYLLCLMMLVPALVMDLRGDLADDSDQMLDDRDSRAQTG